MVAPGSKDQAGFIHPRNPARVAQSINGELLAGPTMFAVS